MSCRNFVRQTFIIAVFSQLVSFYSFAFAQDKTIPVNERVPLPDPLTLQKAIQLTDIHHPDLELANSRLEKKKANVRQQKSSNGVTIDLNITGQVIDPVTGAGGVGDSLGSVVVSKPLYDFGKTGNRIASAEARLDGEWALYFDARQKRKLEVTALFFDVLLADLRYRVDDETMARVYVQYDKVRERHKLGQYSDVQLLKYESIYRKALGERIKAQARQRATRSKLAIGMNRPDDLAGNLSTPILDDLDQKLPEYEVALEKILKSNPVLIALKHEARSAEKLLRSAKAIRRPAISAELEANQFERPIGTRNDSRASVIMNWPLYQGGLKKAAVVKADAKLRERRAMVRKTENLLRQQVLELLQHIEVLQYQKKAAEILLEYRDLQLDESRALYEMEARATLGDAMIGVTDAQWQAAKVKYDLALAWARLKAFRGELLEKTAEEKYR